MDATRCSVPGRAQNGRQPIWHDSGKSRFDRLIESSGVPVRYARDVEIYGEGEFPEYFYKVLSGAVRTYRVLLDGRRQICTFSMQGEYFGFETDNLHRSSAEAIAGSEVLVMKRRTIMLAAEDHIDIMRQTWSITDAELRRVQAHVLLLIMTAKQRVAAFLMEMAARVPDDGELELPMGRQDIADYLGLTIETVSRMLTELEQRGAIRLPKSRRVVLSNREALLSYIG